jgi:hypothetical protein
MKPPGQRQVPQQVRPRVFIIPVTYKEALSSQKVPIFKKDHPKQKLTEDDQEPVPAQRARVVSQNKKAIQQGQKKS